MCKTEKRQLVTNPIILNYKKNHKLQLCGKELKTSCCYKIKNINDNKTKILNCNNTQKFEFG